MSHDLLIEKLVKYSVGPEAVTWVKEYLAFRMQYVVLGRMESRMSPIQCGVPQGSVIGPLMYAIFVNDMTETVKQLNCQEVGHSDSSSLFGPQCRGCGVLTLYAVDSTYMTSSQNRQHNEISLRRCLDVIQLYLNDSKLVLNMLKTSLTKVMIAQKRAKTTGEPPTLIVVGDNGDDKEIEDKIFTRILGSNIQNNMRWKSHMESGKKALLPQCRKILGLF